MPFGPRPFRSRFGNLSQDRDEPMFPPLPPEEEEGILSSVYRTGLSSLGWLGEALDKPGSAVRGLLAGKPDQLLNLIPFSDTAGLTNPETRVSGRDLLEKGGLVGPNQEGLDWGDVAGFGASVLLDPLLYASFGTSGALTAAGRAAAKSGTLAKTMAGRIGSGQAGLMSLGVPWPISRYFPDAYVTLGKGPWAEKFAEVLGKVGGKVQTLPVARELRGLFDSSAGNTADPVLQRLHAEEVEPLRQSLREEALGLHAEALRRAEAGGFFNNRAVEDTMRDAIERNVSPTGIPLAPEHAPAAQLGHWAKGHIDDAWRDAKEMGVPIGWLEKHFPRGMAPLPGEEGEFLKAAAAQQATAKPFHPSMLGREEIFQGPSRTLLTEEIEKGLLQDPFLSGPGRLAPTDAAAAAHIRQKLLGDPAPTHTVFDQISGTAVDVTNPLFAQATKQAEGLARWAGAQSARHLNEGHPFFNPPITDFKNYMVGMADTRSAAHGVLEFLKQSARPAKAGDLHITDAVKQVGLESQGAAALLKRIPGATADSHTIPKEAVEAATRYLAPFQSPEALKPIVGAVDYFTNMFRKLSYSSWPASWMRNAIGVVWQNYVAGAIDKTAPIGMGLYRPLRDAWNFMNGKAIDDLAKAPAFARMGVQGDDEATRILADVLYKTEAAGPGASSSADALVTGPLGQPVPRAQHIMPGSKEAADLPDFTRAIPKSREDVGKYLKIHKVGGAGSVKTEQPWIAEGERMVRMVDQAGRISAATAFVKQGYDLEVAARMAKAVHYDYSKLSEFEKHVMRRVIPFYSFSRHNLPYQLKQLVNNPAKTAEAIRFGQELGPDEQYVPEYLRGGTAIPIGDRTEDGHQTFISQFGLPFEEAFGRVHPGSPLRTIEEYLGTTNPLIKGPLELLTGRQFYSGRELGELYGPTEALGLPPSTPVDQLIMNSPLTRMYTSAQTIMNPNKTIPSKAVNLLSGVRMTDVDVEKQKGIEGRKLLDQLLKEDPAIKQFQRYYVPQENLPELTPHNALLMRLESTLAQRAKAEALKRKAEVGDQEAARQLAALRARMGG